MPNRYDKYRQNFIDHVANCQSKPSLFKGQPTELMPEDMGDDDDFVSDYLNQRKEDYPGEEEE